MQNLQVREVEEIVEGHAVRRLQVCTQVRRTFCCFLRASDWSIFTATCEPCVRKQVDAFFLYRHDQAYRAVIFTEQHKCLELV